MFPGSHQDEHKGNELSGTSCSQYCRNSSPGVKYLQDFFYTRCLRQRSNWSFCWTKDQEDLGVQRDPKTLVNKKKAAWNSYFAVATSYLCNQKAEHFVELSEVPVKNYCKINCNMKEVDLQLRSQTSLFTSVILPKFKVTNSCPVQVAMFVAIVV